MHTIRSVALQTGLSPDVIRVWEKRYQAVMPKRTQSNQRIYTDKDISRLRLLKTAIDSGRRISAVAKLDYDELSSLVNQNTHKSSQEITLTPTEEHIGQCFSAIIDLESSKLEAALTNALSQLGSIAFLTEVISPLLNHVGDLWLSGKIRTCQEHFGSTHIRTFLGRLMIDANAASYGPYIVVSTPTGHWHEIGASMAALISAQSGWKVIYLGANVPIEEIAFVTARKNAKCVALSLSYASNDPKLGNNLRRLRALLPESTEIIAGGSSMLSYQEDLKKTKAHICKNLDELKNTLFTLHQV